MNKEIRIFSSKVEIRAAEDQASRHIVGTAAKVNSMSRPIYGWFREIIEPGAFDSANMDDVVALKNHDMNMIVARTINQSLELRIDDEGNLVYEFDSPNTNTGNDLLEEVRTGLIQHSSFSFDVEEDKWEYDDQGNEVRRIIKFRTIYDVSPVVNPAYWETEVTASREIAKRSRDEFKNKNMPKYPVNRNLAEAELKHKRMKYNQV